LCCGHKRRADDFDAIKLSAVSYQLSALVMRASG
jgi:hypothetical protein